MLFLLNLVLCSLTDCPLHPQRMFFVEVRAGMWYTLFNTMTFHFTERDQI